MPKTEEGPEQSSREKRIMRALLLMVALLLISTLLLCGGIKGGNFTVWDNLLVIVFSGGPAAWAPIRHEH